MFILTEGITMCVYTIHRLPFCHMPLMLKWRQRYKPFHSLHAAGWMHLSSWSISLIRFNPPVYLVYGWTIINIKACISLHSSIQFHCNHSCIVGASGRILAQGRYQCVQIKVLCPKSEHNESPNNCYHMICRSSLHEYKYCTSSSQVHKSATGLVL